MKAGWRAEGLEGVGEGVQAGPGRQRRREAAHEVRVLGEGAPQVFSELVFNLSSILAGVSITDP